MATVPECTPELLRDTRGPELLGVTFGLYALAVVAVVLRFASRYLANAKYWWDDWAIVCALVLLGATSFATVVPMHSKGLGMHVACADPDAIVLWLKDMLVWAYMYVLILVAVKYSILLFLRRLFSVYSFKIYFWVMWVIVSLWGLGTIITTSLSCIPLKAFWGDGPGKCLNTQSFFIASAIPNIVTDVALLTLPIIWIAKLHLPRAMRLSLIGVFACGSLVVIISCYRLHILLSSTTVTGADMTYNDVPEALWTVTELNIAIVSACLPSLSPLVKHLFRFLGIGGHATTHLVPRKSGQSDSSLNSSRRNPASLDYASADVSENNAERHILMHQEFSVERVYIEAEKSADSKPTFDCR